MTHKLRRGLPKRNHTYFVLSKYQFDPVTFKEILWLFETILQFQTRAILFLKSMSERVGSDIERLWIFHIYVVSKSIEIDVIEIQSRFMSYPTFSDTDFKK